VLGAIDEQIGQSASGFAALRESLIPVSRCDFGIFAASASARQWQAKDRKHQKTF
jgi:hypothetical protein